MRFVDGDHRNGLVFDDVLKIIRIEAFRCDVDQLVPAGGDIVEPGFGFSG